MTLSVDAILHAKQKIEEGYTTPVFGVRVASDLYAALQRPAPLWLGESMEDHYARAAMWGLPCIVDEAMAPGTWEVARDRETWRQWREAVMNVPTH
jgi:hypothetical protein